MEKGLMATFLYYASLFWWSVTLLSLVLQVLLHWGSAGSKRECKLDANDATW
jgi:hypothetical protein